MDPDAGAGADDTGLLLPPAGDALPRACVEPFWFAFGAAEDGAGGCEEAGAGLLDEAALLTGAGGGADDTEEAGGADELLPTGTLNR